jgi:biopolymer transport protein ExbD
MKIRNKGNISDKIELQMTPMIDIVFQLIAFFVMSLKIVSVEGDFNIKMPIAAPSQAPADEVPLPPIRVRLTANPDGNLAAIQMGERPLQSFSALNAQIRGIVGADTGPGSLAETAEVELDCDYDLHYQYVIAAVTAVSGYIDQAGHVVKLIDKVKFSPPKQ